MCTRSRVHGSGPSSRRADRTGSSACSAETGGMVLSSRLLWTRPRGNSSTCSTTRISASTARCASCRAVGKRATSVRCIAVSDPTPQTRRLVLLRDAGRCVWCGRPWGSRLDLHHRLLRSHGTDNRPSNLLSLCGSGTTGCHGAVHHNREKARTRGHVVAPWDTPALVPVLTWRGLLSLDDDGGWSSFTPTSEPQKPLSRPETSWPTLPPLRWGDRPGEPLTEWEPPVLS